MLFRSEFGPEEKNRSKKKKENGLLCHAREKKKTGREAGRASCCVWEELAWLAQLSLLGWMHQREGERSRKKKNDGARNLLV